MGAAKEHEKKIDANIMMEGDKKRTIVNETNVRNERKGVNHANKFHVYNEL